MSASTIKRPDAEHQISDQRAASADLIRTIDGVDAPAAVAWEIGRG